MSSSAATAAFAAATAGSANPKDQPKSVSKLHAGKLDKERGLTRVVECRQELNSFWGILVPC